MTAESATNPSIATLQGRALVVGVVFLGVSLAGLAMNPEQFFHSYLVAFLYWLAISLGSLGMLMIHHAAGGRWGFVTRRITESSSWALLALAVLFIPILFGMEYLYPWTDPALVESDAIVRAKAERYLNTPFFILRAAIYFLVWGGLAYLLNRWSMQQDQAQSEDDEWMIARKMRLLSGPGIVFTVLLLTLASVDWVMSIDPHWFSTLFGFMFAASDLLSGMAFSIIVLSVMARREPLSRVVNANHYHDLGNLLMAFVMLWAYLTVSQYIIVWSGNLQEEVTWYIDRNTGFWNVITVILAVFHFAVPFMVLLTRKTKRSARNLVKVAAFMLVMRWLDLYWITAPSFHHGEFHPHWLDLTTTLGIGGVWLTVFAYRLKDKPPLPAHEPQREALLAGAGEHA